MFRPSKEELIKYSAYYKKDSVFAASARLQQSKWRVKNGYPINTFKKYDYGNFIETGFAIREKVNYSSFAVL